MARAMRLAESPQFMAHLCGAGAAAAAAESEASSEASDPLAAEPRGPSSAGPPCQPSRTRVRRRRLRAGATRAPSAPRIGLQSRLHSVCSRALSAGLSST
jgi:hypothetical protein